MGFLDKAEPLGVHDKKFVFKAHTAGFFVDAEVTSKAPTRLYSPWVTFHLVDIEHCLHWFAAQRLRVKFLTCEVVQDIAHGATHKRAIRLEDGVVL